MLKNTPFPQQCSTVILWLDLESSWIKLACLLYYCCILIWLRELLVTDSFMPELALFIPWSMEYGHLPRLVPVQKTTLTLLNLEKIISLAMMWHRGCFFFKQIISNKLYKVRSAYAVSPLWCYGSLHFPSNFISSCCLSSSVQRIVNRIVIV